MLVKSFTDELAWQVQRELVDSYFRPEIKVMPAAPIIDRDTCLEAARIMASVPYSKQEVVNCLKHLIPDIDSKALNDNALPDKNVEKKEEPPKKEWKEFYKQGVPVDVSKLKKQIRQQKIKVSEIAHKAGVSDSTIYNILNGKTRPTKEQKKVFVPPSKRIRIGWIYRGNADENIICSIFYSFCFWAGRNRESERRIPGVGNRNYVSIINNSFYY